MDWGSGSGSRNREKQPNLMIYLGGRIKKSIGGEKNYSEVFALSG